jgi:fructose-bisphosphate aldolase class II
MAIFVAYDIQQMIPGTPIVMHGSSSVPEDEVKRINAAGGTLDPNARSVDDEDYLPAAKLGVYSSNAMIDGTLAGSKVRISVYPIPASPRKRLGWKQ